MEGACLFRINDLRAEPPLARAVLQMDLQGAGNWAGNEGPVDVYAADTLVCEVGEAVWEEIETVGSAAGALVYDLRQGVSRCLSKLEVFL